jgi:hypothetical protein
MSRLFLIRAHLGSVSTFYTQASTLSTNIHTLHPSFSKMAPKVLFVLTSASKLGKEDKPTGWYLPEFAHPYYKLAPIADIVVASPAGGEAPLDPSSVEAFKDDEESTRFLKEKSSLWKNTEKLSDFLGKAHEFSAIFYVGGHGRKFFCFITLQAPFHRRLMCS